MPAAPCGAAPRKKAPKADVPEESCDGPHPHIAHGMHAKALASWRVAACLEVLRKEINAMAPGRSKASDGTIGNAAHATRDSDHNPWVLDNGKGVVTALDITHDPAHGCDCGALAETLRANRDGRIKYVIWNRQIMSAIISPWKWRPYSGANPHNKHVHISVRPEKDKFDSQASWDLSPA